MDRDRKRRTAPVGSDRLIDIHEVAWIGGISSSTARRLIQRGVLPGPTFIGGAQIHRWSERAIRVAFGLLEAERAAAG